MNDLLRAAPRPSLVRALSEYNPFYLLSAMCMLAGLFALNDSLDWSPLPSGNLLWLILILNLYELLLITIGIFLARRQLMRDAATLLVLEAFFLADAGFLNAEAFGQNFELGLAINIFLFVLAAAKVLIVFAGLGLSISDPRYTLILSQMLILLATPGLLKVVFESHNGGLPPLAIYAVWWVVGLIPIMHTIFLRGENPRPHRGIVNAFVALPMISILAHLCTSNWVYHIRWYHTNLSPLLLGLAVAIGASDWHVRTVTLRMRAHLLLPALAILLAMSDDYQLNFWMGMGDVAMSPLRLTLLAAAMVYLYGMWLHHHIYFGLAGTICLGLAGVGHTPEAMTNNTVAVGDRFLNFLRQLVPQTLSQWGLVSVVASFVLLALGLALSLLRLPSREAIKLTVEDEMHLN